MYFFAAMLQVLLPAVIVPYYAAATYNKVHSSVHRDEPHALHFLQNAKRQASLSMSHSAAKAVGHYIVHAVPSMQFPEPTSAAERLPDSLAATCCEF